MYNPQHDLLSHLVQSGQHSPNRTGCSTYASIGHTMKYDLERGFPAPTAKKLAFESMKGELLGFWRGYDNAADFRALNCKIWDQNANETPSWLASPYRKGPDDLGRTYPAQWTKWRDTKVATNSADAKVLADKGYALIANDKDRNVWVYERFINQVEEALRTLITDPYNRRIIITGWRPDELEMQCLPCCHVIYSFNVMPDGKLHTTLWMRSLDSFLSFNVTTLALFTHVMARLAGLQVGTATLFVANAHLYENHVAQAKEQLSRTQFELPTLWLSDDIKKIASLDEIKGVFERIEAKDIKLINYQSHPAIKAPMAA